MSSTQPLVSVLTPVYNGEKYLAECIESILAQTYTNWEYIIVNNCSTDCTLEIAQRYARLDHRIRIHDNQTFVGMIQNHNIAFQQISPTSSYCKMVHADDWLFPECIAQMVKIAEAHPSVSIVGSYGLQGCRVTWDGLPYPSMVVPGQEICRRTLFGGFYVFGSPTSLLIRAEPIRKRKTFYNEANIHADKEACFDLLQDSDFGFVHQVLTYSRLHSGAATSFSDRFNTYLLGSLVILTKYGHIYLDYLEHERFLKRHMKVYYTFLGQCVFRRRGKEFWDYHKNGIRDLGYSFSQIKLVEVVFLEVIDALFNPKETTKRIVGKLLKCR
jgi:glycosyltransferase involved in cell wall biosynthesis